ncbi:hypothetical protein C0Q57_11030 [Streptomyces albidoflavus]|uniref:hypothetical protein n=2 Tax=Streptomyces TaxID=1883 RepID=UPI00101F2B55|nr:hypothetical protein [Streptomyces albidoflavus]RZD69378.1 hypothetical protein C0Q57_11030 [Streptomyces albidoflavus]
MNAAGASHRWPDPDLFCMKALHRLSVTADAVLAGQGLSTRQARQLTAGLRALCESYDEATHPAVVAAVRAASRALTLGRSPVLTLATHARGLLDLTFRLRAEGPPAHPGPRPE